MTPKETCPTAHLPAKESRMAQTIKTYDDHFVCPYCTAIIHVRKPTIPTRRWMRAPYQGRRRTQKTTDGSLRRARRVSGARCRLLQDGGLGLRQDGRPALPPGLQRGPPGTRRSGTYYPPVKLALPSTGKSYRRVCPTGAVRFFLQRTFPKEDFFQKQDNTRVRRSQ